MTSTKAASALLLAAIVSYTVTAHAMRHSGAAFHSKDGQASVIIYADGAATNTDATNDRVVIADFGQVNAGTTISGAVEVVGNSSVFNCTIVSRETASGVSHRFLTTGMFLNSRQTFNLTAAFITVASSISLECTLGHANANGQVYIYSANLNGPVF